MKQCLCYIKYVDGTAEIIIAKLESGLSFSLAEAEKWIKEQSTISVESVHCSKIPIDLLETLNRMSNV